MTGYPKIIVTGDSIAQLSFKVGGYGAALVDQYQGKVDVINRGMGGYNSKQLLMKLRSDLVPASGKDEVLLFIVHIGTNDSAESGFQRIELEAYHANLIAIVGHLRKTYPSAGIILLTPSTLDPPAVDAWEDTLQIPTELRHPRYPRTTVKYVEACLTVGNKLKVPVVNCFDLHQFAVDSGVPIGELYTDGLHYSEKGYSYINNEIMRIIQKDFPRLNPEPMSFGFPDFWLYGQSEGSPAMEAAPMYESIRADALRRIRQAEEGGLQAKQMDIPVA